MVMGKKKRKREREIKVFVFAISNRYYPSLANDMQRKVQRTSENSDMRTEFLRSLKVAQAMDGSKSYLLSDTAVFSHTPMSKKLSSSCQDIHSVKASSIGSCHLPAPHHCRTSAAEPLQHNALVSCLDTLQCTCKIISNGHPTLVSVLFFQKKMI